MKELCLVSVLLTVAALVALPIARYYWIKATQNAQVIRYWDKDHLVLYPKGH